MKYAAVNLQGLPKTDLIQKRFSFDFDCPSENIFCFGQYFLESITFKNGAQTIRAYSIYQTYCDIDKKMIYMIFGWTEFLGEVEIDEEPLTEERFDSYGETQEYLTNKCQVIKIRGI